MNDEFIVLKEFAKKYSFSLEKNLESNLSGKIYLLARDFEILKGKYENRTINISMEKNNEGPHNEFLLVGTEIRKGLQSVENGKYILAVSLGKIQLPNVNSALLKLLSKDPDAVGFQCNKGKLTIKFSYPPYGILFDRRKLEKYLEKILKVSALIADQFEQTK